MVAVLKMAAILNFQVTNLADTVITLVGHHVHMFTCALHGHRGLCSRLNRSSSKLSQVGNYLWVWLHCCWSIVCGRGIIVA